MTTTNGTYVRGGDQDGNARAAAYRLWATEDEVVNLSGVPAEILRRGIAAGLFNNLPCVVGGSYYHAPDVVPLVAWSDKLGDDVVAGRLTHAEATRMLWARAAQLRRRTATLQQKLAPAQ